MNLLSIYTGYALDLIIGDPYSFPHPVRYIGKLISMVEKQIRKITSSDKGLKIAGFFLWFIVVGVTFCVTSLILQLFKFNKIIYFVVNTILIYTTLATKCLKDESVKIYKVLKTGDLEKSRIQLSYIVGRDTTNLNEKEIVRATVETVAENTSDGVIAPFLFMAIFGPVGGTFYKAVNTMDSMIGYTNDKYILFGRTAAKLDDVLNFIPARISGCLLTLAAYLLPGADGKNAWRIFLRDRRKHASPNSAHGEAACAGALHLRLAGDAWYFGVLHKKQFIGDNDREIVPEDIWKASLLMFLAEGILMVVLLMILAAVR